MVVYYIVAAYCFLIANGENGFKLKQKKFCRLLFGGLIPNATFNARGLAFRDSILAFGGTLDNPNIDFQGTFIVPSDAPNLPSDVGIYGLLLDSRVYGNSAYIAQLLYDRESNSKIWFRCKIDTWRDWHKLATI